MHGVFRCVDGSFFLDGSFYSCGSMMTCCDLWGHSSRVINMWFSAEIVFSPSMHAAFFFICIFFKCYQKEGSLAPGWLYYITQQCWFTMYQVCTQASPTTQLVRTESNSELACLRVLLFLGVMLVFGCDACFHRWMFLIVVQCCCKAHT